MNTLEESRRRGQTLRQPVPRSSHGAWAPSPERPDPIGLLQAQDEGRLEHLLPIKYGRMVGPPFAFLRGSAVVMAADLAKSPMTGLQVQLCGDAHLSNFGVFATLPEALLRAKRVLYFAEELDRRTIYQRVGEGWRYTTGEPWGDVQPHSSLVFIGPVGLLDRPTLAARLDACLSFRSDALEAA